MVLMRVKIDVVAPMPSAIGAVATTTNPGALRRERSVCLRSLVDTRMPDPRAKLCERKDHYRRQTADGRRPGQQPLKSARSIAAHLALAAPAVCRLLSVVG